MLDRTHPGAERPDLQWHRSLSGEIEIAGQPLSRVVAAVGGTPCYLYDRERINVRVQQLRQAMDPEIRLYYALKANPMPAVVAHLSDQIDGMDVASAGEMRIALDAGVAAERISFAGPGKSLDEIHQAVMAGVTLNIESFRELDVLEAFGQSGSPTPSVAIRVNLPFELKRSGMRMTGGPKQFGIDADQVPEAMRRIRTAGIRFEGFHLYTGSQNLNAETLIEAQRKSYDCVLQWMAEQPGTIRSINLGGGFGIPYTVADPRLDVDIVTDHLNSLARKIAVDLPGTELVLELGRYLVGEAGIYVCSVVDRKQSRGKTFLVTNGGLHQHLAATGNFGQVLRRNYPMAVNSPAPPEQDVDIVGPLCTPLDLLGKGVEVNRAEIGDLVVIFQSGAYGRTVSPASFLSHPEVREALI